MQKVARTKKNLLEVLEVAVQLVDPGAPLLGLAKCIYYFSACMLAISFHIPKAWNIYTSTDGDYSRLQGLLSPQTSMNLNSLNNNNNNNNIYTKKK